MSVDPVIAAEVGGTWLLILFVCWAFCRAAAAHDRQLEQARARLAADEARTHSTIYTASGKVHVTRKLGERGQRPAA